MGEGTCNLLPTKRIQQRGQDVWDYVYGVIGYWLLDNTITSNLEGDTFLLVGLEEQAVILCTSQWREAPGKELGVISGQQGTETFSLAACKELNTANYHLSLEVEPSPVEPQMRTYAGQHFYCRESNKAVQSLICVSLLSTHLEDFHCYQSSESFQIFMHIEAKIFFFLFLKVL